MNQEQKQKVLAQLDCTFPLQSNYKKVEKALLSHLQIEVEWGCQVAYSHTATGYFIAKVDEWGGVSCPLNYFDLHLL